MADILISKSRGKKYLGGSAPMVPSFIIGDDPVPLNPPGSGNTPVLAFTQLTDTQPSYTGQASKVVSVKVDESGLEFTTGGGGGLPPIDGSYASQAFMIAGQGTQTAQYIYFDSVQYWEYLGTTLGTIADYKKLVIGVSPYDLKQEGATDGQVVTWVTANSRYEPITFSGSSNWTVSGLDIYRNSKVTIGQTSIITADLGVKQVETANAFRIDGLSKTSRRTIQSIYEGAGIVRFTIDNYGIPIWRLYSGTAEAGALAFTTPNNDVGILTADSDVFTAANRGYAVWNALNTVSTTKSFYLGSRNTDRMLIGGTGKFSFNGGLVSNVSFAVYQIGTDVPFAVYTGSTVRFFVSATGEIRTTAPPSGGNSSWRLGARIASTVAFDTTQYIEIQINNVTYKLALAV